MSTILRLMGWGWLLAGLLAITSVWLAQMGAHFPVPQSLAASLALPWSLLAPMLGAGPKLELAMLGLGVFINAQILFVIANILGD